MVNPRDIAGEQKISPKSGEPQRYSWGTKKKEEKRKQTPTFADSVVVHDVPSSADLGGWLGWGTRPADGVGVHVVRLFPDGAPRNADQFLRAVVAKSLFVRLKKGAGSGCVGHLVS